MKDWLKTRFILLLTIFLVVSITWIVGCSDTKKNVTTDEDQTVIINIGGLVPLTGFAATLGESATKGMDLAIRIINNDGGIKSMGGAQLKLISEDLSFDPILATKAVEKLISEDQVAVIFGGYGPGFITSVAASQRLGGVYLAPAEATPATVNQGYKHYFQMSGIIGMVGETQVDFLDYYNKTYGANLKKAVALSYDAPEIQELLETWSRNMENIDISIQETITYPVDWSDPTPYVYKIRSLNPDVVLMMAGLPHLQMLLQTMKEVELNPIIMNTIAGFTDQEAPIVLGELAEGGFSAAFWNTDLDYEKSKFFIDSFHEVFPNDTPDQTAAVFYQSVMFLAKAMEHAQSTEAQVLSDAMRNVTMTKEEMLLPYERIAFNAQGLNENARFIIVQMQNGQYKTVFPEEYASSKPVKP